MNAFEFATDGSVAACALQDGTVRVMNVASKHLPDGSDVHESPLSLVPPLTAQDTDSHLKRTLVGHTGPVYGVSVSPDGRFCLSAGADGSGAAFNLHVCG